MAYNAHVVDVRTTAPTPAITAKVWAFWVSACHALFKPVLFTSASKGAIPVNPNFGRSDWGTACNPMIVNVGGTEREAQLLASYIGVNEIGSVKADGSPLAAVVNLQPTAAG
jgi:hypothetical protein